MIEISLMIHYVYYDCVQFGRLLKQQIEAFILKPLTDWIFKGTLHSCLKLKSKRAYKDNLNKEKPNYVLASFKENIGPLRWPARIVSCRVNSVLKSFVTTRCWKYEQCLSFRFQAVDFILWTRSKCGKTLKSLFDTWYFETYLPLSS